MTINYTKEIGTDYRKRREKKPYRLGLCVLDPFRNFTLCSKSNTLLKTKHHTYSRVLTCHSSDIRKW